MPSLGSAREVSSQLEQRGFSPNFCHVPFTTLIFEPDGTVGSCRQKGTRFIVGDLKKQTWEEIWNGPRLREWRRQFLEGEPQFCKTEVRCNGCHLCPDYNALLPLTHAQEIQDRPPLRLGLNLNGRCNLECKMCHIWKEPNGFYDSIGFWPELEKLIAVAREIELFSGEPFIQKDTYRLIEIVSRVNPDCLFTFTTNGHWLLNDKIRGELDKIKIKHLTVSMDSLQPENYARIRRKGDLAVVLENLNRLIDYDKSRQARGLTPLDMKISFAVQRDNWQELGAFHEFGKERGIQVFRTFVNEPLDCSLMTLTENEREKILEACIETMTLEQLSHSRRVMLRLMDSLPALSRAHLWSKWSEVRA